jgi:hypothetical protein
VIAVLYFCFVGHFSYNLNFVYLFADAIDRPGGGKTLVKYHITVDCFKSFCMESNPRNKTISRAVRRYYLDLEKKVLDGDEATIVRMFGNRDARLGTKTAVTVTSVAKDESDTALMHQHLKDALGQMQSQIDKLSTKFDTFAEQQTLSAVLSPPPPPPPPPSPPPTPSLKPLSIHEVLMHMGYLSVGDTCKSVGAIAYHLYVRKHGKEPPIIERGGGQDFDTYKCRAYYECDRPLLERAVEMTPDKIERPVCVFSHTFGNKRC